jgi:hypothetical protein
LLVDFINKKPKKKEKKRLFLKKTKNYSTGLNLYQKQRFAFIKGFILKKNKTSLKGEIWAKN